MVPLVATPIEVEFPMMRFEFTGRIAEIFVISFVPILKLPVAVTDPSLRNTLLWRIPESLIISPVVPLKEQSRESTDEAGPVTKSSPTFPLMVLTVRLLKVESDVGPIG